MTASKIFASTLLGAAASSGAFFVTRAKSNIDAHRVYSAPTDRSTGIICDQTISLDGFYTRQDYPELLRRIRFKDPESGKTLVFITNNFSLPAATICALYKSRWQVELFFKWIKQHLRIKQLCTPRLRLSRHLGDAVQPPIRWLAPLLSGKIQTMTV